MSSYTNQTKENVRDVLTLLGQTWTGVAVSAGIVSKLFDDLSTEIPKSVDDIAEKKSFDKSKLESWFYIMENCGIVKRMEGRYLLTEKGNLLTANSPSKDVIGMYNLNRFYMLSAINAFETFKPERSLDKLSEGKMSNLYTPRVTDKFSDALLGYLKLLNVGKNDRLLDVGCGRGNFIKRIAASMPDLKLTGIDANGFAIETGRSENAALIKSGKFELIQGDITHDLDEYEENSFEWCTAINVFHFVRPEERYPLILNLLRIAKKGVLLTLVVVEKTELARSADPLMFLLWNDFTGFFREEEFIEIIAKLKKSFKGYGFRIESVMEGNSNLVAITKQEK